MFIGILPLVLSPNRTNIKFKQFLSVLMIMIGVPLFIFKLVMVLKYQKDDAKFQDKLDMWKFLGVYGDKPGVSCAIDFIQIMICSLLVWHYSDQKKQACKRLMFINRLDYQTEIKLHHPYFGRKHKLVYIIAYLTFLVDAFVMIAVPQLVTILILIGVMLAWESIVNKRHILQIVSIRIV